MAGRGKTRHKVEAKRGHKVSKNRKLKDRKPFGRGFSISTLKR